MKEYLQFINNELQSRNVQQLESTEVNGQEIVGFTVDVNGKNLNIVLFHAAQEGVVLIQFFTSFHSSYKAPDKEFYLILDEMNMECIMGNIFFTKEAEEYFISYRSNYVAKEEDFVGHSSFKEYLSASIAMVEKFDSEINIL